MLKEKSVAFMKKCSVRRYLPAALALMILCCPAVRAAGEEIVAPTCTQDGYALMRHPDGTVTARRNMPAPGHSFGPWTFEGEEGEGFRVCLYCGEEERFSVRREGLPRLLLQEDGGTVFAALEGSGESDFSCEARLLCAREAGSGRPGRVFDLQLFEDGAGEVPLELTFPGWQTADRYTLTACDTDPSAARRLTADALWREAAAARPSVPERLRMLPLLGGEDGFPVTVWLNGSFSGLYMLSPRFSGSLFGMYRDENAAVAAACGSGADTLFRGNASLSAQDGGWTAVWQGAGTGQPACSRLNQLIRFVMESDGPTFRNTLDRYLDVDAAVDAMLFSYALGLTGNGIPVMLYYGERWIPSVCGTEEVFGAEAGGLSFRGAAENLPSRTGGGWNPGTDNLLFERLLRLFEDRVAARYRTLRETVLTQEHILSVIDGQVGRIPSAVYALNARTASGLLTAEEERARIMDYLRERLPLLDAAFGGK